MRRLFVFACLLSVAALPLLARPVAIEGGMSVHYKTHVHKNTPKGQDSYLDRQPAYSAALQGDLTKLTNRILKRN